MRNLVLIFLLLTSTLATAEIYKWMDDQGRLHYGSQPPRGVEAVPLDATAKTVKKARPPEEAKGAEKPATDLASCLADKGFKFYGASWCSACRKQLEYLNASRGQPPYIECSIAGARKDRTSQCRVENINAYPTWVFPDGTRKEGVYSAKKLARLSGCSR